MEKAKGGMVGVTWNGRTQKAAAKAGTTGVLGFGTNGWAALEVRRTAKARAEAVAEEGAKDFGMEFVRRKGGMMAAPIRIGKVGESLLAQSKPKR